MPPTVGHLASSLPDHAPRCREVAAWRLAIALQRVIDKGGKFDNAPVEHPCTADISAPDNHAEAW